MEYINSSISFKMGKLEFCVDDYNVIKDVQYSYETNKIPIAEYLNSPLIDYGMLIQELDSNLISFCAN